VHPVRVVATTGSTADDAARLLPELRRELEQLALGVPALASRRGEIPGLVERFALQAADEERLPRPRWDEEACAALWRQPWPDNVRELEALVHRVVLLAQGGAVGVELLEQGAGRSGPLLSRLPSRRPERRDVEAALDATRTRGGRWNKTRAASLLGWDPDTLAARLRDLGLAEGSEP
jgi:DNA-binding NtrC family response regulator